VGKIIIDEYRAPDEKPTDKINVGGGGPQSAFGAAAALALLRESMDPQPVTFVGAVGELDWKDEREGATLRKLLEPAVEDIHLLRGPNLYTPRIQLYHDEDQNLQWQPLNDSFGPKGAASLWKNRPSPDDFLKLAGDSVKDLPVICQCILEGGAKAAGDGGDVTFLEDELVRQRIGYLGLEPITFPDEETGILSPEDALACYRRLDALDADVVSPDMPLFKAMTAQKLWSGRVGSVRDGPRGSQVVSMGNVMSTIPAASLVMDTPVNPTGAGNAYSAALTTCLGVGIPAIESACIASAIGAVFVEYEHIPPWNEQVLERIEEATLDVKRKMK